MYKVENHRWLSHTIEYSFYESSLHFISFFQFKQFTVLLVFKKMTLFFLFKQEMLPCLKPSLAPSLLPVLPWICKPTACSSTETSICRCNKSQSAKVCLDRTGFWTLMFEPSWKSSKGNCFECDDLKMPHFLYGDKSFSVHSKGKISLASECQIF